MNAEFKVNDQPETFITPISPHPRNFISTPSLSGSGLPFSVDRFFRFDYEENTTGY